MVSFENQNISSLDVSKIPDFKLVDQKYYIKNLILGKGNFAVTYLATLKDDQTQLLACKMIQKQDIIIKLKSSKNPEARKEYIINSLKNEVQLWKQLDHQNIVKFVDFSETQNNIYFFLEYCDSGDLEKDLKKRGKLSEAEALPLFKQIVDGIHYLYEKGVFHRDLKPENILINKKIAKIADFGFSKVIEEKDQLLDLTAVGTPYYMAPQILEGQQYSIKCDVWSTGVMFYQIIYGYLPWVDNTNINTLVKKIRTEKLQFAPSVAVSDKMKELIQRMLTLEDEKRISIKEVQVLVDSMSH